METLMTTPDVDPNEQIPMRHPDSGPIGYATRAAFDALWRDKGWREVSAADVAAAAEAPAPSDGMTVAELRAAAKARGVDVPAGAAKADLLALLA